MLSSAIRKAIKKVALNDAEATRKKKIQKIREDYSDRLIIIDEVHNIRDIKEENSKTDNDKLKATTEHFKTLVTYADKTESAKKYVEKSICSVSHILSYILLFSLFWFFKLYIWYFNSSLTMGWSSGQAKPPPHCDCNFVNVNTIRIIIGNCLYIL